MKTRNADFLILTKRTIDHGSSKERRPIYFIQIPVGGCYDTGSFSLLSNPETPSAWLAAWRVSELSDCHNFDFIWNLYCLDSVSSRIMPLVYCLFPIYYSRVLGGLVAAATLVGRLTKLAS